MAVLTQADLDEIRRRIAAFRRSMRTESKLYSGPPSRTFEFFCFTLVAEAFRRRHYQVRVHNPRAGVFVYKDATGPNVNPNNYSFFALTLAHGTAFELRSNVRVMVANWFGFTMDFGVVIQNSVDQRGRVNPNQVQTFGECKNRDWFPELLATIVGQANLIQPARTFRTGNYQIPAVLLTSGDASQPLRDALAELGRRGMSIGVYCSLRPSQQPFIDHFLTNWF